MGNRQPVRTCVACRQEAGKGELVRVVRGPDGTVALDRTGRMPGRGAYLHADPACLELARKRRALDRALGVAVPPEVWAELRPGDGAQVSNSPGPA
jgi:uncharacterized protein